MPQLLQVPDEPIEVQGNRLQYLLAGKSQQPLGQGGPLDGYCISPAPGNGLSRDPYS